MQIPKDPSNIEPAQALDFTQQNKAVRIKRGDNTEVRAIALTPINNQSVTLITDKNGQHYAISPSASRPIGNAIIKQFSQTRPLPKKQSIPLPTGYIAVLFRVREGDNIVFYVGGFQETPIKVAEMAMFTTANYTHSQTGNTAINGSLTDSTIESTPFISGIRSNYLANGTATASVNGSKNTTSPPSKGSSSTFIYLDQNNGTRRDPRATAQISWDFGESGGETDADSGIASGNLATQSVSQTNNILSSPYSLAGTSFINSVSTGGLPDISSSHSASLNVNITLFNITQAWMSGNASTLFVGIKYRNNFGSGFDSIDFYEVSVSSGTVTNVGSTNADDWQAYLSADAYEDDISAPDSIATFYQGENYYNRIPSTNNAYSAIVPDAFWQFPTGTSLEFAVNQVTTDGGSITETTEVGQITAFRAGINDLAGSTGSIIENTVAYVS